MQQLLEEQSAAAQLERRLGEAEVALSAAAEELVTLRNLNVGSGRDRDESVQAMMTQLHDRVRTHVLGGGIVCAQWIYIVLQTARGFTMIFIYAVFDIMQEFLTSACLI